MRWLLPLLILLMAVQARAENLVVGGVSQHSVSLTTNFSGSELFIYGAFETSEDGIVPDIIITVTGPSEPVQVRKKERVSGIWINGKAVQIDEAPSFYAVATTREFRDIVTFTDDLRHRIHLDQVIRLIDAPNWVEDREEYRSAVARIREQQGLYSILPGNVLMIQNKVFETRIKLPANLVEGDYKARIFLLHEKQVLDVFEDKIEVRRGGLGQFIYSAAQDYPAPYGIASILIALLAGWLASAFFRTFFPT